MPRFSGISRLFLIGGLLLLGVGTFIYPVRGQVISEIMYDPKDADSSSGGEWVEIYNNGGESIDPTQWKLFDSVGNTSNHKIEYLQGASALSSGQYAVISKDPTAFLNFFTGFSGALFKSSFTLSVDSETKQETIIIRDKDLNDIDSVTYSEAQGAKNDGNSLQKSSSGWIAAPPTPGADTVGSTGNSSEQSEGGESDNVSVSSSSSAHYSSVPVTNSEVKVNLKVGAGRARLGSVGSPIEFLANSNVSDERRGVNYTWSFGDASLAYGEAVTHTYFYPGDYAVVLNAEWGRERAVARVNVKIVPDSLVITAASADRVEVANNGNTEVNLFGRGIMAKNVTFFFPKDTIILAGQKISFPSKITGIKDLGTGVVMITQAGGEAEKKIAVAPPLSEEDKAKISEIKAKILALEREKMALREVETRQTAAVIEVVLPATSTEIVIPDDANSGWLNSLKHFFGFN